MPRKKQEEVVDAIEVESAPLDVLPELPTEEEMIAEEEALQPEVEEVAQPEPVKEHDID